MSCEPASSPHARATGEARPASCPGCRATAVAPGAHPGFGPSRLWRCGACGTELLHPQPSDDRLGEIYGESYYEPWHLESPERLRAMKERSFAPLVAQVRQRRARRVLDLGCGTGELLAMMAGDGRLLHGIDLNPVAIAHAARRLPDARLHAGTLADEPFDGEQFDAITMVDFIEHVRDPESELRRAARRLAAGGVVLISTPRTDSVVARVTRRAWPQYREEHLTYFSLAGLSALLQRCGLVAVRSFPTRKAITPAYLYGQALAYPSPLLSSVVKAAWKAAPLRSIGPCRLWFGEMTVVAQHQSGPRPLPGWS